MPYVRYDWRSSRPLTEKASALARPFKLHIYTHSHGGAHLPQLSFFNHGLVCRCKAFEIHQIPSRVQSEGRHAKGEHRGHEEVCSARIVSKVGANEQRRWIAGKISEILGNEDDVVIELCFNLLEGSRFVCLHAPMLGIRTLIFL